MPDKTSVTNSSVSESEENLESSLQGQGKDRLNDSNDVDSKGVSWKNRAKEYQSKFESVSEKLDAIQSRLEELQEKEQLNARERAEKSRLQNYEGNLEQDLYVLEHDPKFKPYVEKIDRSTSKAKEEAVREAEHNFSASLMEDFLEDSAEKEKIKIDELRDALNEILSDGRYRQFLPHKRAKLAYRDYVKSQELSKREKALLEKEKNSFSEGEGSLRNSPKMDLKEATKARDVNAMLKAVGL